ncbi:MAG: PAS domain S-box protein [Chitinophagaceae bacterium]|nr:PAS domain S-box protein [Chitinophagaceae bacterium]
MSSNKNKNSMTRWLFTNSRVAGLIVFLLLGFISYFFIRLRYDMKQREEKEAAMAIAQSAKSRLQQSLQYSLSATQALTLIIDKEGVPRDFDSIAAYILQSNKYMDALQLVPGGVIKYIYPLDGNEAAVGYDILKDSTRNKEAFKAIEKKELFFAGPFELKQGGLAVVGRLPFFLNNKFWGFSAVIIKMPTLLRAAGIDTSGSDGYYYQISKINPDTKKEEFFLPHRENTHASTEVSVTVPNGEWQLSVMPVNGYEALETVLPIAILGLILSVIGGAFAIHLSKTPARLQKMVMEKTEELEKSERRNKAIVNALPDMVLIIDREGRFIDYNNPLELKTLVPREQFMGKKITDIIPGDLATEMMENLKKVLANRQVLSHSYQMRLDNEEHDYEARYVPQGPDDVLVLVREVTENKKAELRIKESEQKYRTLVEQAGDSIFIANMQGQIIVANPASSKLSGYSEQELLQMKVHELTDARELMNMPFRMEDIAAGKVVTSERKLKHKDGYLIEVEVAAKLISSDRFLAFVRDITERKKAITEIKQSNDRFNFIALATNDVIWDWDLISGNMWWNENFYSLFKLEKEKVKPGIDSWYDGLHPDDLDRAKKSLQKAIANKEKTWTEEYRFLKSDGEVVDILDRGYVVFDTEGRPYRMIGSMLDITERKRTEMALRESEYRLKTILDTDPECIKLMSRDVKLIDINSSGLNMIEADNIQQVKNQSLLDVVAEEYRGIAVKMIDEAFEGKTGVMEFEMLTLKGKRRWCEISIVPFRNADGKIIAALGVTRDMTKWKSAEEKLKRSFEEIRRLSEHLQNIREDERLHVAREIHDELGQQLTVLKMDVSRLGKNITASDEKYIPNINEILDAINNMVDTVRKISSELRPGLLDDLGLAATLDWYCHDFGKRTGTKTTFISDIKDEILSQKIKIGLFRIFQESLTNVARHSDAKKVDVSLMQQGQQLVLLIEDNGKGFDTEAVAEKKTLGITGMKERALMIGGTYNIYSTPGKGAIIEVAVPFHAQELIGSQ